MQKFATVIVVNEEDGSSIMSGYVLPDDFEPPDEWITIDISVFMPSEPSVEKADKALTSLGAITHGFTEI